MFAGLPSLVASAGVAGLLGELGRGLGLGVGIVQLAPHRCPKCGARIPERLRRVARYCPYCGEKLLKGGYCPECKLNYDPSLKYCPIHGIELGEEKN